MPFFLESCRRNPDVNWHLFSDCGQPDDLPTNVRITHIHYEDYLSLISRKLEIDFHPEHPYKLCDIKPAYGFIHEDVLQGYDFWGFGDIDLVYGNLREYFTRTLLSRYDLISNHARRISGHLCLIRNNSFMNTLFKKIPDWPRRFCGPHQGLDEGAFSRLFLWRKNFPPPLFRLVGLFNPLRRRSIFREAYSTPNAKITWMDNSRNFPSRWFWQSGRLTNDIDGNHTFPYLHFMVWKSNEWARQPQPSPEDMCRLAKQENWQISAQGFGEFL
jgi:hypothetical protein